MNKEQALALVEQGLNVATQKGVFIMSDVHALIVALEVLKGSHAKSTAEKEPVLKPVLNPVAQAKKSK